MWSDEKILDTLVNGPNTHWENSDSGRKGINSFGLGSGFITANLDSLTNYFWNPVFFFFKHSVHLEGKFSSWFVWVWYHKGQLAALHEQDGWWLLEVPHGIPVLRDWEKPIQNLLRD